MNGTVVTAVSGATADMIQVSTQNGQMLESGPAESLLQVGARNVGWFLANVSLVLQSPATPHGAVAVFARSADNKLGFVAVSIYTLVVDHACGLEPATTIRQPPLH